MRIDLRNRKPDLTTLCQQDSDFRKSDVTGFRILQAKNCQTVKKSCSLYVQHLVVNYFSKETFLRILLKTVVAEEKIVARVFNKSINKFVQTKMRPKEGTKIELQRDLSDFVRFVRIAGLDLSDLSNLPISAISKKRETDGPTDPRNDQRTDPHIEMRGRI